jgi:hypothetical protein
MNELALSKDLTLWKFYLVDLPHGKIVESVPTYLTVRDVPNCLED